MRVLVARRVWPGFLLQFPDERHERTCPERLADVHRAHVLRFALEHLIVVDIHHNCRHQRMI